MMNQKIIYQFKKLVIKIIKIKFVRKKTRGWNCKEKINFKNYFK